MSCGIGHRQGLDLALLWLWCRLVAAALIRPLAWEPPYAAAVALKKKAKKKKKKSNTLLSINQDNSDLGLSALALYDT